MVPALLASSALFAGNTYPVELFNSIMLTLAEAPARVEQGSQKFLSTMVSVNGDTAQPHEIQIGGSAVKLVSGSNSRAQDNPAGSANGTH